MVLNKKTTYTQIIKDLGVRTLAFFAYNDFLYQVISEDLWVSFFDMWHLSCHNQQLVMALLLSRFCDVSQLDCDKNGEGIMDE